MDDKALVFYGQGGDFFVGDGDASAEERIKSLLGESSQACRAWPAALLGKGSPKCITHAATDGRDPPFRSCGAEL